MENIIHIRKTNLIFKYPETYTKLHSHNLYVEHNNRLFNLYTCMCCTDVFIQGVTELSPYETPDDVSNIPTELLELWKKKLDSNKLNMSEDFLEAISLLLDFINQELKRRRKI